MTEKTFAIRQKCHVCGRFKPKKLPCKKDHINMLDSYYQRQADREFQEAHEAYIGDDARL